MNKDWKHLGSLKPEEKVLLAIDLTDCCLQICADGIRNQCPDISEEELFSRLCERLEWPKRQRLK